MLSDGVVYYVQNKTIPTENHPFRFCLGRSDFYEEVTTLITGKILVLFLHVKTVETIHNIYSSNINSFGQQNNTKIQPTKCLQSVKNKNQLLPFIVNMPRKMTPRNPFNSPLLTKPKGDDFIIECQSNSRDFHDKFIDEKSSRLLKVVDNLIGKKELTLYSNERRGIDCKFQSISNQDPFIYDVATDTSDIFSIMLENADNVCPEATVKRLPHPLYYCATYDPENSNRDTRVVGFKFELDRTKDKFGLMKTGYETLAASFKVVDLKLSNFKTNSDRTNCMSKFYIAYAIWNPLKNNNNRFTINYKKDENDDDTQKIESVGFKVNYNVMVNNDDIPNGQFTYDSLVEWGREILASIKRVTHKVSENKFKRTGKLLPLLNDPSTNPTLNDTTATTAETTLRQLLLKRKKPKPTKPKTITEKQLTAGLEDLRTEIMEFEKTTDSDSFSDFMAKFTVYKILRDHFHIEVEGRLVVFTGNDGGMFTGNGPRSHEILRIPDIFVYNQTMYDEVRPRWQFELDGYNEPSPTDTNRSPTAVDADDEMAADDDDAGEDDVARTTTGHAAPIPPQVPIQQPPAPIQQPPALPLIQQPPAPAAAAAKRRRPQWEIDLEGYNNEPPQKTIRTGSVKASIPTVKASIPITPLKPDDKKLGSTIDDEESDDSIVLF